jgi:hypothetical protein
MYRGMTTFTFPVAQFLQQSGNMDCGVCVFGALAGLSREEILRDRPQAADEGLAVDRWVEYLESKGWMVTKHRPDESCSLPCAHLVDAGGTPHWIYQTEEGVFDPNPANRYMPANDPRMLNFSLYASRILLITIARST